MFTKRTERTLVRLGFLRVNGIELKTAESLANTFPIIREPSVAEIGTMTRNSYVPWFWWIIHCAHNKLWSQACGTCNMSKTERAERLRSSMQRLS
jgi:hypothetical protein